MDKLLSRRGRDPRKQLLVPAACNTTDSSMVSVLANSQKISGVHSNEVVETERERERERERESERERERDKSKLKRIANVNEKQRKRKRDGMRHSIRTEHMHNYRASFAAVSTTHAFLNYAYAVNRASCLHTAR